MPSTYSASPRSVMGPVAVRFGADTRLPLLALSTTVRIRAWEERYTICFVDNFASLGCDTRDLASDPIFLKLSTSIPGLTPPLAKWVVNPKDGGNVASIYVREQDKDNAMPAALNAKVRAILPGSSGELRVDWRLWRTNARGRVLYSLGSRKMCLNETVPAIQPIPSHSRPLTPAPAGRPLAARAPPAAGSWAAAVLHGVKRLPTSNTLHHRPKKKGTESPSVPGGANQSRSASPSGALPTGTTGPVSAPKRAQQSAVQRDAGASHAAGDPHQLAAQSAPITDSATLKMLQQLETRLTALEQSLASTNAVNASIAKTLTQLTGNISALNQQQQATSAALNTITQQLIALTHRMELSVSSPATMLQPAFGMGPYQHFMTPPMTMSAMQNGMLSAGAVAAPTAYASDPTAMQVSYARGQHQIPSSEQLLQLDSQPMQTYDPSLAAESSAIATPAHNGAVGIHG